MNQMTLKQEAANQSLLFSRAQQMASGKTDSELEQIARNICATKGIDFDEALKQFKAMWNK